MVSYSHWGLHGAGFDALEYGPEWYKFADHAAWIAGYREWVCWPALVLTA